MMKNLLAPYEQRPWAQTNWILVRLWRVSILHSLPLSLSRAGWTLSISVSSTTKTQLVSSLQDLSLSLLPGLWLWVQIHTAPTPAENQA